LVVVDCCKAIKYAADFFAQLQRLYVFMSGSFVHPVWLKLQTQMYPKQKAIELKSLSQTRWTAQIAACDAVKSRLDVILVLLEQISEDANRDRAVEAQSILHMIDLKFVFCLEIFHVFLREMKSASDCLQSTQLNANIACDLITNCLDFLHEQRSETQCMQHVTTSKNIVCTYGLSSNILKRRSRFSRRFEVDMVVTESVGRNETSDDVDVFLRSEIYYPVIDKAITELNDRFSEENMKILRALRALMPGTESFLNGDVLAPLASNYKANMNDVNLELRQLSRMIERKEQKGTMPTFEGDKLIGFTRFIGQYNEAFFELNRLAQIACTIPVTSVQSERSFSCLKLVKTHLRTTMLDDRLSDIAVLSIHTARARSLDLDKVVDKFIAIYPHCRINLTL
jgi:hAT family C-terminal dimerisation region